MTDLETSPVDTLVLGHRIRHFRRRAGLTLKALGARVGKPAPHLSQIENGHTEPRLSLLGDLATALDCSVTDLLAPEPPSRRAQLEVALARAQDDPAQAGLKLPYLKPSAKLTDEVLEHIVGLYDALSTRSVPSAASGERHAQIVNLRLRQEMRARDNYYGEIEATYYQYMPMVTTLWIDQDMKKQMVGK